MRVCSEGGSGIESATHFQQLVTQTLCQTSPQIVVDTPLPSVIRSSQLAEEAALKKVAPAITEATVRDTRTGRYLRPIDLPEQLEDLFPNDKVKYRIIAAKSKPDQYLRVRMGFYPPTTTSGEAVIVYRTVHANAKIHTSASP